MIVRPFAIDDPGFELAKDFFDNTVSKRIKRTEHKKEKAMEKLYHELVYEDNIEMVKKIIFQSRKLTLKINQIKSVLDKNNTRLLSKNKELM